MPQPTITRACPRVAYTCRGIYAGIRPCTTCSGLGRGFLRSAVTWRSVQRLHRVTTSSGSSRRPLAGADAPCQPIAGHDQSHLVRGNAGTQSPASAAQSAQPALRFPSREAWHRPQKERSAQKPDRADTRTPVLHVRNPLGNHRWRRTERRDCVGSLRPFRVAQRDAARWRGRPVRPDRAAPRRPWTAAAASAVACSAWPSAGSSAREMIPG